MSKPDVLVIGAGVFGLWTALEAARAGLSVLVVDRDRPGAGASGGLVGALTPHMPVRWRPMKQFQFDALLSLEQEAARLADDTGLDPGYARSGRLSPLIDARARARADEHAVAARTVWGRTARFEVLETPPPSAAGMFGDGICAHGLVHDTLSGRIQPRAYLAALEAAVAARGEIRHAVCIDAVDPGAGTARAGGEVFSAGHIVVAAGWESFPLAPVAAGQGVKGQAALLAADLPRGMPVVQMPDLYVVPHGPGRVAVGSTSEKTWQTPGVDPLVEDVIARARHACPALETAEVIERWAGIRPKAPGREPMIGGVPGHPRLWMATGGYKIGLGIAHLAGRGLAARIAGIETAHPLPEDFSPAPLK